MFHAFEVTFQEFRAQSPTILFSWPFNPTPKPYLAVIQRSALRDEGSPACPAHDSLMFHAFEVTFQVATEELRKRGK
jgi:hypothetical protein